MCIHPWRADAAEHSPLSRCLKYTVPPCPALQDPHFKAANYRRRIIQRTLLAEYAYLLRPGGLLYTITDVEDLGNWQVCAVDGGMGGGCVCGGGGMGLGWGAAVCCRASVAGGALPVKHDSLSLPQHHTRLLLLPSLSLPLLQRDRLEAHPLFERVSDEELEGDAAAQLLLQGTEEGQKVARNSGKTWRHVYRRVAGPSNPLQPPPAPAEQLAAADQGLS